MDATGVGAPVVDLFKAKLNCRRVLTAIDLDGRGNYPRSEVQLEPIQITGGDKVTRENRVIRIPKRDLVSAAQVALQTERLKVASVLAEAATLARELQNFQVKIDIDTAHDSYGAWGKARMTIWFKPSAWPFGSPKGMWIERSTCSDGTDNVTILRKGTHDDLVLVLCPALLNE